MVAVLQHVTDGSLTLDPCVVNSGWGAVRNAGAEIVSAVKSQGESFSRLQLLHAITLVFLKLQFVGCVYSSLVYLRLTIVRFCDCNCLMHFIYKALLLN